MSPGLKNFPDFLIIGAAKCGTTALHNYLGQHPQVFMTEVKEPRFFLVYNNELQKQINIKDNRSIFNKYDSFDKYASLFANAADKVKGESSPQYLAYPHCSAAIKSLKPEMKLIVILRNPVERAYSQFIMHKNWRIEPKSFEEAVFDELKGKRRQLPIDMQYLKCGLYYQQLLPYFDCFSLASFLILKHEDLKFNPQETLRKIFIFLGVEPDFKVDFTGKHNVSMIRRFRKGGSVDTILSRTQNGFYKLGFISASQKVKNVRFYYPAFPMQTLEKLLEYFHDDILCLSAALRTDYDDWLNFSS